MLEILSFEIFVLSVLSFSKAKLNQIGSLFSLFLGGR